jgi:hypothetical protein
MTAFILMRPPVHNLRPAAHIHWAVEIDGVVILNEEDGSSVKLAYPQAAIWDFITRGESMEQITGKIAVIAAMAPAAAERLVTRTRAELLQRGFLSPEGTHG